MNNYRIEDISLTVTEHCPGPCRYCSIWKLPDRRKEEMSSRELDSIFSSRYLDLKKVHITGGEPHLSDTYIKAVDSLYKFHKDIVIDTPITGWYPDRHLDVAKYVLKKCPIYRLDISFDGDEKIYPLIRLHKRGYEKALETLEKLKKIKGVVLRLQFTIYRENFYLIEWVYNFAKKLGVGLYIGYGRFNPERFQNDIDNLTNKPLKKDDFIFSRHELEEIDRQLRAIGYHESRYASKYCLQKAIFEGKNIDFNCYMGTRSIDVDPYGNVYPCLLWLPYLKMGNIRESGSFDAVLAQGTKVLGMIKNKQCHKDCLYTCANKCEIVSPNIKSVGLIKYPDVKYGFIFSENDVIPIRPWWYNGYKIKGIL
jgi:radical SAM protein with 4Fe4S-binding SPASM domain